MKKSFLLLLFVLMFLVACQSVSLKDIPKNAEIAKLELEKMGYQVKSFESEINYTLTEETLKKPYEKMQWSVQRVEASHFFGQTY